MQDPTHTKPRRIVKAVKPSPSLDDDKHKKDSSASLAARDTEPESRDETVEKPSVRRIQPKTAAKRVAKLQQHRDGHKDSSS